MPRQDSLAAPRALPQANALRSLLLTCARIPRWADAVLAEAPASASEARAVAERLSWGWTWAEVEAALATHPRIGERPPVTDADADSALARREQAGVGDTLAADLHAANVAHEQRFGHVFLIRAAGRSGAEILAEARRRLALDAASERRETTDQLREIALLRLEGMLP
ncbi:2-oxo-4-hydroxy-4-carboxy-5-ureidoimidazoline decarboxylase [Propioniciclava soli]|uniref:2-oxo-4-hydroxy-4-carboxy-5-ureidoimidazoline decarboxylase n=1 Tax=Propioniciclava soli TaxID=2775081 RepID=A0ABZ3CB24_9ACTN|nr:2-oxo-4-hydroxy-4-carboxy-5-ureidoimidazoline decarboxylase [Propioniciclava soli]